jgi:hypothetical protein
MQRLYYFYNLIAGLCGVNCFNRAYICTGTTIGAYIRINFVDVALGDSFNRTLINTGSACSAIFTNFVSHVYDL